MNKIMSQLRALLVIAVVAVAGGGGAFAAACQEAYAPDATLAPAGLTTVALEAKAQIAATDGASSATTAASAT